MDEDPFPSPALPGSTTQTLKVEVHDTDNLLGSELSNWLESAANTVCAQLNNTGEVRVLIVNDESMSRTHARYCGLNSTTDVLTFDLSDHPDPETKILDTDLVLCIDEARRQSALRAHNTVHELLLYTIHGVLHCLGYNDQDDHNFARMHAREDELLTSAGFEKLFDASQSSSEGNRP